VGLGGGGEPFSQFQYERPREKEGTACTCLRNGYNNGHKGPVEATLRSREATSARSRFFSVALLVNLSSFCSCRRRRRRRMPVMRIPALTEQPNCNFAFRLSSLSLLLPFLFSEPALLRLLLSKSAASCHCRESVASLCVV
jgi:hypothetical protein